MDSNPILAGLEKVTAKWTKQRKAEERSVRAVTRRASMWTYQRHSLKDICGTVMAEAYNEASDNGRLPTHWRQVFYRARPLVADHPEADRPLTDSYFKQVLEEYLEEVQPGWDILRGARGVFKEPHVGRDRELAMSTMNVRRYLQKETGDLKFNRLSTTFPTAGARNRFGAVLICEKEGFDELLQAAGVPARYDLALMATKGISALAARDLARRLRVPCFTLHDFDKNGFVMAGGFPFATDIGIRLADMGEWDLAAEEQPHRNRWQTINNLIQNGATSEEAEFVADGQRVELNELTGPRFVEFVEQKLEQHGVKKVIPDDDTLASAWRHARLAHKINDLIDQMQEEGTEAEDEPPDGLDEKVRELLDANPEWAWDAAIDESSRRAE